MVFDGWFGGRMMLRVSAAIMLEVVVMAGVAQADPMGKEITKESKKELDIQAEVVAFYKDIVVKNPEVVEEYQKLVAAAQDESYRSVRPSDEVLAVEWLVDDFHRAKGHPEHTTDGEYVYLAVQQLFLPFHSGYLVKKNIVAKIRAVYHSESVPVDEEGNSFDFKGNTLKLKFEGFVDLKAVE